MACSIALIFLLTACGGGGGGGSATTPEPTGDTCNATSVLVDGVCQAFALQVDARAPTAFTENRQPVSLEVVLFKPLEEGRFPTIVFNHGSTGNGSDPSRFGVTFTSKTIARYFVERGWLRSRADVDTTRMLVGGSSRGGILSVTYVAQRPEVYLGAINFVGGWIAEGCGDYRSVNRTLFVAGAAFPGTSLWLYGANDSFYSLAHSRTNFDSFSTAGGLGAFNEFTRSPGLNGHFLINDPQLWALTMDNFLGQL